MHLGFVHIHPFWDGNGRMARLLANLPLLRSGHLPMVIELKDRKWYIEILAGYQIQAGQLGGNTGVWPNPGLESAFVSFCQASYEAHACPAVPGQGATGARLPRTRPRTMNGGGN